MKATNTDSVSRPRLDIRGPVLAWTIFTTTFLWTPTMRLLYKPEISHWNLFGLSGTGRTGAFLVFPGLVILALTLFYLGGRSRFRPLFYGLLLAWHVGMTLALLITAFGIGLDTNFIGAAWGFKIRLWVLAIPFGLFAIGAIIWVWQEARGKLEVVTKCWHDVAWSRLLIVAIFVPLVALAFRLGDGYGILVKVAIVITIIQWILLAEALGGSAKKRPRTNLAESETAGSPRCSAEDGTNKLYKCHGSASG